MKRVVTIGREYGSGGRLVAQKVADELEVPYYDKQILGLVAKEMGLSESSVEEQRKTQTSSLLYNLYMNSKILPVPDEVFTTQSKVIKRLAEQGPCVFIGRCANHVLQDRTDVLRVFIHAPLDERIKRACEMYGDEPQLAHMQITRHDREREAYYNHFTTKTWGKAQDYDLTISSSLGIDNVVQAICALARARHTTMLDGFADLEMKNGEEP